LPSRYTCESDVVSIAEYAFEMSAAVVEKTALT
jgi:hypothetical protein